jgi:TolB-like protein/tetratricopeptide (TPR) repeat protein
VERDVTLSLTVELSNLQLGWRMAVLPFRSIGAPIGYGIALGMAEEVSAALSRLRAPRMIATATFWDGTGPASDALARCRTYQLDYIVDGSIRIIGDQIRVNVRLLDVVLDFEVIWTGHFDGQLDDLFSLQHRIAAETVAQVDPELFQRGAAFDPPVRTEVAAAHHAVLTAIQGIFRLDRPEFMHAREHLVRAIELDPGYAAAHAWIAYWSIMAVGQGWVEDPRDVTALAGASAERAIALDPVDARALAIAGHVKGYLLHDVRSALDLHARAIALSPDLPIAWTLSSWSKIYNGEHATAIRHAMMSRSLSPRDPHIFFVEHALMTAHFFAHQLEEAEMLAEVVLERNPRHASALNVRLAILGQMGRQEEASHSLALLRTIDPEISVEKIVARPPLRPDDRAFYIDGLLRAGVPHRQSLDPRLRAGSR